MAVLFGPSDNSDSFYSEGFERSVEAPAWISKMGLNAYEYGFDKGIHLKDETAIAIGTEAKKYNLAISAHAPYYINFGSADEDIVSKSYKYVLESLRVLKLLGGKRLVVHVGSVGKNERERVLNLISERLKILVQKCKENGFSDMFLCLETMGKFGQIGTYQEIIDLCTIDEMIMPTFDFGHIHAITGGGLKTEADYETIFDYAEDKLSKFKYENFHVHFSKVEYGAKGEIRHLTFEDKRFGPEFMPLAKVLKKRKLSPVIICESKGTMAEDALEMKNMYENI